MMAVVVRLNMWALARFYRNNTYSALFYGICREKGWPHFPPSVFPPESLSYVSYCMRCEDELRMWGLTSSILPPIPRRRATLDLPDLAAFIAT